MIDASSSGADTADRIRRAKGEIARGVTEAFFERHPDWKERYGEAGVQRGIEDATFHLEFLAAAVEIRDPGAFRNYGLWAADILHARRIPAEALIENFEQIGKAVRLRLGSGADHSLIDNAIAQTAEAIRTRATDRPEQEDTVVDPASVLPDPPDSLREVAEVYLGAILSGVRSTATRVLDESLGRGTPVLDLYLHVIQRAQYRLGELWATNRITVAQEHMASAVTQAVLAHLYPHLPEGTVDRGPAIVTGVKGELHQIGAHMVADVLEADGWHVRFLGTHLPKEGIVEAAESEGAALVAISATMLFSLGEVGHLIRELRRAAGARPLRILVGGRAFRHSEEAWRRVGADAQAPGLVGAREAARELQSREAS